MSSSILFWFRRDLRAHDNVGLHHALTNSTEVHCVFILDRTILDALPSKADRRVEFIWESVVELKAALEHLGGSLIVQHDHADHAVPALAKKLGVSAVYTNEDYEPDARARDTRVAEALASHKIAFQAFKDTVIFEKSEVLTQAGGTFGVFTPYKNAWLKKLRDEHLAPCEITPHRKHFAKPARATTIPSLESMGFQRTNLKSFIEPGMSGAEKLRDDFLARMSAYRDARDFPAVKGVSYLSVHNRFGTLSIRELASIAYAETLRRRNAGAETWLSELIWRDFYFQIIWHHPHAAQSAFRPEYDAIAWPNDRGLFAAWCEARTGFPLVDAAMRQLNETGYMHNRLRMVTASFLVKDLLIDWRWGERYFAEKLNDFDLAANNGGWQWAASTGCDAQPYFRIFNPVSQSERFDPDGKFIRRYLPELDAVPVKYIHAPWTMPPLEQQACGCEIGRDYPSPVVDHAVQREKALSLFKAIKGKR